MTKKRSEVNGGQVALSGFYFQFLATISGGFEIVPTGKTNEVDPKDVIGYECEEADIVQFAGKTVRIIQVKYSKDQKAISLKAAKEIQLQIEHSASRMTLNGATSEYVLQTNRILGPSLKNYCSTVAVTCSPKTISFKSRVFRLK